MSCKLNLEIYIAIETLLFYLSNAFMIHSCYCMNKLLINFLLPGSILLYKCTAVLFIDSVRKGHLSCFQFRAIMIKAAINILN